MKSKVLLFAFATIVFATASCQQPTSDKKQVKQVAYAYEQALGDYDLAVARHYATEETKSKTLVVAEKLMKSVSRENIEANMPAKIKISKVKILSDTTATANWHKETPIKECSGTLELRKRNGKWLAHDMIKTIPSGKE